MEYINQNNKRPFALPLGTPQILQIVIWKNWIRNK